MRINKYLRDAGLCSRRKSEELVLGGKVKVNGKAVTDLAFDVSGADIVEVNGKIVDNEKDLKYIILNKPKGYLTTKSDDLGRKTVMDILGNRYAELFPVGRLDYNTEGLLLLTNDGELSFKLTHPKHKIEKTYVATIKGDVSEKELDILRGGIYYQGVRYSKCKAFVKDRFKGNTKVCLTITEGKNHEVRKMFEFLHKDVHLLKRIAIGSLTISGLDRGEFRSLNKKEIEYLENL